MTKSKLLITIKAMQFITSKRKHAIRVTAALAAVTIIFLTYYISTSLWFFHGLVESKSPNVTLAITNAKPVEDFTPHINQYILPQDATEATRFLSRYAIGASGDQIVIAGLPRLRDQLRVSDSLLERGWQVKRVGLYIYAENQTARPMTRPSNLIGYKQALAQIKNSSTPISPLGIAQVSQNSLPYIDRAYAAIAYWKRGRINIDAALGSREIAKIEQGVISEESDNNKLDIAIQSGVLQFAPTEIIIQWEQQAAALFGFKNTTPAILRDLVSQDRIAITQGEKEGGEFIAISVDGKPEDAYAKIESWLLAEAAYDTPIKKAFRLPDGTLGYEYVPGGIEDESVRGARGCHSVLQHEKTLWVCITDTRTMLTTDKDIVPTPIQSEGGWRLALPIENFGTITSEGTPKTAHIEFQK